MTDAFQDSETPSVPSEERRASRAKGDNAPTLLTLPAELRNAIYRLVLVVDIYVEVDDHDHHTHSLLRTCRQLRKEASSFFLDENIFWIIFTDLRARMPIQHWAVLCVEKQRIALVTVGSMHWNNLKQWLKIYHENCGTYPSMADEEEEGDASDVAAYAFNIVDAMQGLPWLTVEAILEEYRRGTERGAVTWT